MKKILRALAALLAAMLLTVCLAACGGNSGGSTGAAGTAVPEYDTVTDSGAGLSGELAPMDDRKIIYTAHLDIECTDLNESLAALEQALAKAGGYVQASDISEYDTRVRANLVVRVPAEHYRAFVAGASAFGNVTQRTEDTEDVTLQYVDIEARLTSLQGQRDRLVTLRDAAEDLATLLEIEEHLADVQYQLESYTSQMKALQNQISYCTVNFYLTQPIVLSPSADDFGAQIGSAFARGTNTFIEFLQDVVLFVVENIFFLLLIALIAALVATLRRKTKRRKKAKPAHPADYSSPFPSAKQTKPEPKPDIPETE